MGMGKLVKWKSEYLQQLAEMTGEEILTEYTSLAGGDDYDGCYTNKGEWKWEKVKEEFKRRLTVRGFFRYRNVLTEKSWT